MLYIYYYITILLYYTHIIYLYEYTLYIYPIVNTYIYIPLLI